MVVTVDLSGLTTEKEILCKFGEVFEFGGPDGNVPVTSPEQGRGWGMNWNALNDSFRSLEEGGIWGTSKQFAFPLEIVVEHCGELQEADPDTFRILKEILYAHVGEYAEQGKILRIRFD
jgi:hypothetical protein